MMRIIVTGLCTLAIAANAATPGLPTLAWPMPPPAALPTAPLPAISTALPTGSLTLPTPSPLSRVLPSLLPSDLLALASSAISTAATSTSAIVPPDLTEPSTLAPCRFGESSIELDFGQIPAGVAAEPHARQLFLQVECSQASEFTISTREPPGDFGTASERSMLPITLRNTANTYNGLAWALLEQDRKPLASRHFSVPAASPTLIAISVLLLANPESRVTPSLPGRLESLTLARQLYLVQAGTP